jgi:hypothetical protein
MGHSEGTAEDACFKMGRMVATGRDPWDVVDRFIPQLEQLAERAKQKAEWAETAVPQDVPGPTDLFNAWFNMAKNSVGEEGVYPQQFHRQASDGGIVVEALAINGNDAMRLAIERLETEDVAEFVLGIDMSAAPDQGIEFEDFLGVIWFVNGEFYSGVLNYQTTKVENPAFRDVDWDNNYWNNGLRDHPITKMQEALAERQS